MPWFQCEGCGDTLKKARFEAIRALLYCTCTLKTHRAQLQPKLAGHIRGCHSAAFTCIDCSVTFDRNSVQAHVACVTEHEKYALAATKPGGAGAAAAAAAAGSVGGGSGGGPVPGERFLAQRPPWLCSCCGVTCTSAETLAGHAAGKKHRSKARAAEAAAAPVVPPAAPTAPPKRAAEALPAADAPAAKVARPEAATPVVKWRKMAAQALRDAPEQRLKAAKLHRAAVAAARAKHGDALDALGDEAAITTACAAAVAASSRFITGNDGRVTLAAGDADE